MKQTLRRLIALILAMSMAFSLLSTSVWAADLDGNLAPQSSAESEPQEAEPEAPEASDTEDEAEPEEAEDEEDDQAPEAAPEDDQEDDQEPEDDQEDDQEPEADDSQEPDDADASDDADDADASDDADDAADADKGASEDPEEDEDADSLSAQANTPAVIDTAPRVETSLTYWYDEQELLRSGGSANGGSLMYYVSTDPTKPSTDASGWLDNYSNVKKADAGTYYIFYYAKGDSSHSDSEIADPLVCKINPAPVVPDSQRSNPTVHSSVEQVTFNPYFTGGAEEMRYTGAHLYPEVNVKASFFYDEFDLNHVGFSKDITDFSITYYKGTSINESNKVTAPRDVGTYTLEITPKGNYTLSNPSYPVTIQFKVIKGLNNLKVNIDNWTYGDAAKAPTVIQNSGGTITYLYKESDADDSTFTDQVPTQAGTYTLKASSAATADYDKAEYRTAFSIFSRLLTVTVNDHNLTYGDAASDNGVTYSGFVNGENESVLNGAPKITCAYQQGNGVGTYTITPSRGNLSAKNYRFDSKKFYSGTLTVKKKDVTVTAQNQTIDYRDSISQGKVFGTGLLSGHKVSADLSTSDTEVTDNGTITLSNVVIQDAGNQNVIMEGGGNNPALIV